MAAPTPRKRSSTLHRLSVTGRSDRRPHLSPEVSLDEIPQPVLKEVRLGIQHYCVPLLVISPEDSKHPVDLAGSGTLVELAGKYYILTADHVWNKAECWA